MDTDSEVKIEIGTPAEEMGRRFVEAWEAAERGELREVRRHLIFETVSGLCTSVEAPASDLDEAELMAARKAAAGF